MLTSIACWRSAWARSLRTGPGIRSRRSCSGDSPGGERFAHGLTRRAGEELARRAGEGRAKCAVTLGVAAEPGGERRRGEVHQRGLVGGADEAQQAEPRAVLGQREADVGAEVTTDLAGVRA